MQFYFAFGLLSTLGLTVYVFAEELSPISLDDPVVKQAEGLITSNFKESNPQTVFKIYFLNANVTKLRDEKWDKGYLIYLDYRIEEGPKGHIKTKLQCQAEIGYVKGPTVTEMIEKYTTCHPLQFKI